MKRSLITLGIGVVLGFILYSILLGRDSASDAQRDGTSKAEFISVEDADSSAASRKSSSKPFELREEDVSIPKATPLPAVETRTHGSDEPRPPDASPTPSPSAEKRILNFEVSEPEVYQMETRLDSLQREVSLFREDRGWVVKFYSSQNALADTGIRDGDLIRFSHLESMKANPETAELARRLEDILQSLER